MKEFGSKERGNGAYIYDVPSFLIERNGLRYKGTWERHIYIGDSKGGYGAHAAAHRETVFRGPPDPAGQCRGGRGPEIFGTLEGVDRRLVALVRPQVLKTISGAIHG